MFRRTRQPQSHQHVPSIPTLVAFGPDGSELGRVSGAMPRRQLDALIERLTAPASR